MTTGFIVRVTAFLTLSFLLTFSSGCLTGQQKPKSPALRLQTEQGSKLEVSGDAEQPPKISEGSTHTETLLPKGSEISVIPATATEPGKIAVVIAKDAPLISVTKSSSVEGAKSFAPPAPPTPTEMARGQALLWSYGLTGLMVLSGGVLIYLGHSKAGIIALIGAVCVPVLANLLTNAIALGIGAAFLLVSATLYSAWHLMQRNKAAVIVPIVTG